MMARNRIASAVLTLALVAPATAARAQRTPAPLEGLDAYVEKAMKDWQVPGLALAIVKDDSVIYAKGYGTKTLGKDDPVTPHTLFAIASTTKAFTSTLMAMLVDSGKVKWDEPVTDHLPWFELYDPYVTRAMTIRDLLTHRSGLSRGDMVWYASTLDRDQVIRRMRYLKPSWGFRAHFGYQNVMFITAGQLEAAVTGESWDQLVRERIFTPLGMTSTVTSIRDLHGDVATPHDEVDGKVVPIAWRNVDNIGSAGAINSNVLDMAKWVRFQLGDGTWNGQRLVSAKNMQEMHTPQMLLRITDEARELNPDTHFSAYGLGWFMLDYRGREVLHHGGNLDGFSAEVDLVPEEKLGIVILTNMNSTALRDALPYTIYDRFMGPRDKDWSAAYLAVRRKHEAKADSAKAKIEAEHVLGTKPSLPLERYAGVYEDSLYGDVKVTYENGGLVATTGPAFVGDLEHWHYDTFRAVWRDHTLGKSFFTFRLDAMGKPASLEVEDEGVFRRVPDEAPAKTAAGGR